jgi:hypothetical protein
VIFLGSHPRGMSLREGASISPSVRDRTATNKRDRQIAEKPPIATGLLVVVINCAQTVPWHYFQNINLPAALEDKRQVKGQGRSRLYGVRTKGTYNGLTSAFH